MRIACVGGGPGGLFFATLMKRARPDFDVQVFERNALDDTFGFGVVFADSTLGNLADVDPGLAEELRSCAEYWDSIQVRLHGQRFACDGNGMAAIERRVLLRLLQSQAMASGVTIRAECEVPRLGDLDEADLIVAADGANSMLRQELSREVEPSIETASAKFIWFGTTYRFDGLTFLFEANEDGVFAVHGYPISPDVGTFIVETDEESWRRAGLDGFDSTQPPGVSDEGSRQYVRRLFRDQIDGQDILANNSRWGSFRTIRLRRWHTRNVVFIGDAAHTAHFSVGSGTRMAMEDGAALAMSLTAHPDDLPSALGQFELLRRPEVERIQRLAASSLSWWEHFGHYYQALDPTQFAYHFFTRAIGEAKLKERDPEFVAQVYAWWRSTTGERDPLSSMINLRSSTVNSRCVRIALHGDETGEAHFSDGLRVTLKSRPGGNGSAPWGLLVEAPQDSRAVPAVFRSLPLGREPELVAIRGGTRLTRSLLSERIRLNLGTPTLIIDESLTSDDARTLILSGRTDLATVTESPGEGLRS